MNGQIFLQIFGREEDFVQGVISGGTPCTQILHGGCSRVQDVTYENTP
jgi:hypothetical protein